MREIEAKTGGRYAVKSLDRLCEVLPHLPRPVLEEGLRLVRLTRAPVNEYKRRSRARLRAKGGA
jgi:hypothetical protein